MVNLIICVLFFYAAHLFFKMTFSLHKVPYVNFTLRDGDLSGMTALSERMGVAGDNLRQSLFIFIAILIWIMNGEHYCLTYIILIAFHLRHKVVAIF